MKSGLDIDDDNFESVGNEDRMQEQSETPDWIAYMKAVPMVRAPGELAVYGSANLNLAAAAVAHETGEWIPDLFQKHLASSLGIRHYHCNLDPAGNGYMGGGIRLTPRDQLKLGQVMLDKGKWQGKQVLSSQWIEKSLEPRGSIHETNDYGFGWWRKTLSLPNEKTVNVFYAGGNGGQFIVCVPKFGLVIQMSGGNYGNFSVWYRNLTEFIPQQIISAVEE